MVLELLENENLFLFRSELLFLLDIGSLINAMRSGLTTRTRFYFWQAILRFRKRHDLQASILDLLYPYSSSKSQPALYIRLIPRTYLLLARYRAQLIQMISLTKFGGEQLKQYL